MSTAKRLWTVFCVSLAILLYGDRFSGSATLQQRLVRAKG